MISVKATVANWLSRDGWQPFVYAQDPERLNGFHTTIHMLCNIIGILTYYWQAFGEKTRTTTEIYFNNVTLSWLSILVGFPCFQR